MTRLILHIGSHKTGTTAIQQALYQNRRGLRQAGIVYETGRDLLNGPKTGHHGVAHALASDGVGDRQALVRFRQRLDTAAKEADLVVISAEPFLRHLLPDSGGQDRAARRLAYIHRVAGYFDGFDIEISVYLRRPDRFAVSLYKESLARTPMALDFPDYLTARAEVYHYASRLAPFRQVFDKVTVRCFEDAAKRGLVPAFFADHGLPPPAEGDAPPTRPGFGACGALWLVRAKAAGGVSRKDQQRRWDFLLSEDASRVLADPPGTDLWADNASRAAFVRQSLDGFDHADFWQIPSDPVTSPDWTEARQAEAEACYHDWLSKNRSRVRAREVLGAVPYQPDAALPSLRFRLLKGYFRATSPFQRR